MYCIELLFDESVRHGPSGREGLDMRMLENLALYILNKEVKTQISDDKVRSTVSNKTMVSFIPFETLAPVRQSTACMI